MKNGREERIRQAEAKQYQKETALHRQLRTASVSPTLPGASKYSVALKEDRTSHDNIVFDSKQEKERYWELCQLQRAGKIQKLEIQKRFILIEDFIWHQKHIRGVSYYADFWYLDNEHYGKETIEEWKVKATRTKDYIIKWKLMLTKYPQIAFNEVITGVS